MPVNVRTRGTLMKPDQQTEEKVAHETQRKTVLLVEDDDDTRYVYQLMLERGGFRVVTAVAGDEGLRTAARELPDLVLMDISIPEVDGWTAIRRLRDDDRTRDIPVIVVTAHAFPEDRQMAEEVGCDGFLTKPCRPPELLDEVQRLVKGP